MSLSRKRAADKTKATPPAQKADVQPVPATVSPISAVPRDNGTPHTATPPQTAGDIPEELISARAYEIWQQRGCPMGHESAEEDWFAARNQLEQEQLNWAAPRASDKQRGV